MNLRTRKRAGAFAIAFAVVGAMLAPTQANAADPVVLDDPIAFEIGHIDAFNPVLNDDGSIRLALKEDVTGSHVLRTPESVELVVKSAAQMTVPENYLPGMPSSIYYLPLTQDANLIWPGWDTQSLNPSFPGSNTDIVVSAVDGPGQVLVWSSGSFGESISLMTDGGYTLPNTISQPYPAHTHANWAFTAPGIYKLTVQANVIAASNGETGSSQTATYTFVVAPEVEIAGVQDSYADGAAIELTAASPVASGSFEWSVDGTVVAGQNGSTLNLTAEQDLDGAEVTVRQLGAGATAFAASSAVTLNVEEPAERTATITGLAHHYHQGSPIDLTAVSDPAVENASYEWFVQRVDQPAPVQVAGENGASIRIAAEQALDNARVTANVLDESGAVVASAAAVTIDIDDHGAAPFNVVTVTGVEDHYHTGAEAHLAASAAPASVLTRWVWEVQLAGESEYAPVAGENAAEYLFEVTEELDGALVRAVLTFDDGTRYVASEPVEIEIDDHHGEEPVETTLSISGLAEHYHTGDVANLTAVQDPETGENHYHWFIKRAGDADYAVIAGELTGNLAYTVAEGDDGAEIIVRLYDHDHTVIAESAPVVIEIDDHHGGEDVTVTIQGLQDQYEAGSTISLSVLREPAIDHEHYHWFIQRVGETEWIRIPTGVDQQYLTYVATEADNGAQLMVSARHHGLEVAASDPVTLVVVPAQTGDEKPENPPADLDEDALDGVDSGGITLDKSTVQQGGDLIVQVGEGTEHAGQWVAAYMFSEPVLLGGDWLQVAANGTITVQIPSNAALGTHSIAVYDASGALVGWQPIEVTAASSGGGSTPGGTTPGGNDLANTGAGAPGIAIGGIALMALVAGAALMAARRRSTAAAESSTAE